MGLQEAYRRLVVKLLAPKLRKMTGKKYYYLLEAAGVHVSRVHFYQPLPDTRSLGEEIWARRSQLVGLEMNEADQLKLLEVFASRYRAEYESFPPAPPAERPWQFYTNNGSYPDIDAAILYCMVRHSRPRRIIEIGSGFSTYVTAQALEAARKEDPAYSCDFTAIEPYPKDTLRKGFPGLTRLREQPAQEVPLSLFEELGSGDILFIDSSHVVKMGSDVQFEYLEVLPRLAPGVRVHIHDIFFPGEYPKDWIMRERRFWNEQYLLQAFLAFNREFQVLWAGKYMSEKHPQELAAFCPYNAAEARSLWMRRAGGLK
jgi:hypothetical protein